MTILAVIARVRRVFVGKSRVESRESRVEMVNMEQRVNKVDARATRRLKRHRREFLQRKEVTHVFLSFMAISYNLKIHSFNLPEDYCQYQLHTFFVLSACFHHTIG